MPSYMQYCDEYLHTCVSGIQIRPEAIHLSLENIILGIPLFCAICPSLWFLTMCYYTANKPVLDGCSDSLFQWVLAKCVIRTYIKSGTVWTWDCTALCCAPVVFQSVQVCQYKCVLTCTLSLWLYKASSMIMIRQHSKYVPMYVCLFHVWEPWSKSFLYIRGFPITYTCVDCTSWTIPMLPYVCTMHLQW